jgi:hypothetical protein
MPIMNLQKNNFLIKSLKSSKIAMLKKSILHPFYNKKDHFDHFITTLQFALIKVEEQITKPKKLF